MTRILNEAAFAALGAPNLVYVRETTLADLLGSTPLDEVQGIEIEGVEVPVDQPVFAVHGADGARLAVVADRDTAFAAARAHELTPVAVH
jgi:hypothetical protein